MKKQVINNLSSEDKQKLQAILESTNNHEIAKKILGTTKAKVKPENKNVQAVFYTTVFILILCIILMLAY